MNGFPAPRLVCPACERGGLRDFGGVSARREFCGGFLGGGVLDTLRRITRLPEALGSHACECGHPEMRRLPDGVYWCPACGAEVIPVEAADERSQTLNFHYESAGCGEEPCRRDAPAPDSP